MPSCRLMSRMAVTTPNHDPVYLANCGLDAWKRIFTRSSGATTVFACCAVSTEPQTVAARVFDLQRILLILLQDLFGARSLDFACSSVSGSPPTLLLSVFDVRRIW